MNILLDTNIIIPLEDTNRVLSTSFAELKRLAAEQHHCFYIHPLQYDDIKRDKNEGRRQIVLSRLEQYPRITNPPVLDDKEREELGLKETDDNDKVDNNVLFSLYRGAVHLLVTNDEGIHKKAQIIGCQDRVYRIQQFITLLLGLEKENARSYTGVEDRFLYEIDKTQPFFDSLRSAYDGFDNWYQNCAAEKRKCWYINDAATGNIAAICIYKEENNVPLTDDGKVIKGKILKLCTFKVDPAARGKKLGERLLYIAFDHCVKNDFDWVYLHTQGVEQETLVGLCEEYGFYNLGKYKGDDVYIKPMKLQNDIEDSLLSLIRYYPFFKDSDSVAKYIVPIQPKFHDDLFPDLSSLKGSLFEKDQTLCSCQGNTIKKAYLCHSNTKTIKRGDIVLFYRSGDRMSIQCMGIVESTLCSNDINEVWPLIAKRTVYEYSMVESILQKDTLVILFRYIELRKSVSREELKQCGITGNIQSIRKINNSQYSELFK